MILLDTHVVVWLARQPHRLSRPARLAIERERRAGGLAIASVTLMELAQAAARGDIRIARTPVGWLEHLVSEGELLPRELTPEIAAVAAYLPSAFPQDPFDRVIAATAIVEHLPLVTSDAGIQKSGLVRAIW